MKKVYAIVVAVAAALLFAGSAHAQAALNAVRVCAKDPVALAKFYEAAFGMSETLRLDSPAGSEVILNFGATVDAAKANKNVPIVISHHDSDEPKDPTAHLIFNVADLKATVAAIKAAGGTIESEPRDIGYKGYVIGVAVDPVGNRLEILHHP
ncbi:MAG TPA: VOC family protein [Candidatus Acidoferrales bacterium]|jgi:predicted enzyme related to lactoylglutathione lyase|nr:VOC family protein [Candidatus Acidoferrales bacterium]